MRGVLILFVVLAALDLLTQPPALVRAQEIAPAVEGEIRFVAVDVFIDTNNEPLAAYQLELAGDPKIIKIVGVEGGDHPEFRNPPYYDPEGLQHERLILAAFSTADASKPPHNRFRILTVHLEVIGAEAPRINSLLKIAANPEGHKIPAQLTLSERPQP
jgi:hypothetical protein